MSTKNQTVISLFISNNELLSIQFMTGTLFLEVYIKYKNRSAEPEPLSSLNLKLTDRQTQIHTPTYTKITSTCPYSYC